MLVSDATPMEIDGSIIVISNEILWPTQVHFRSIAVHVYSVSSRDTLPRVRGGLDQLDFDENILHVRGQRSGKCVLGQK